MIERTAVAAELTRDLRNHRYEIADDGILFPRSGIVAAGEYIHDVNGQDERIDRNLVPNEMLLYFLNVGLAGGTQVAQWYLALFGGNYSPTSALTAANFSTTATEITSATQGYTETTRPAWTPGTPAMVGGVAVVDNVAARAAFTIKTATSLTIRGAALVSSSTKGGTSGVLASATRFATERQQYDGDVFNLAYRIRLALAGA